MAFDSIFHFFTNVYISIIGVWYDLWCFDYIVPIVPIVALLSSWLRMLFLSYVVEA